MSISQETEVERLLAEKDLHEIFRIWDIRHAIANYDPEPIVRR